jgi:hypothetical protein
MRSRDLFDPALIAGAVEELRKAGLSDEEIENGALDGVCDLVLAGQ